MRSGREAKSKRNEPILITQGWILSAMLPSLFLSYINMSSATLWEPDFYHLTQIAVCVNECMSFIIFNECKEFHRMNVKDRTLNIPWTEKGFVIAIKFLITWFENIWEFILEFDRSIINRKSHKEGTYRFQFTYFSLFFQPHAVPGCSWSSTPCLS